MLADALGNPLKIILTAGQVHDLVGADALLPDMEAKILLADKAFDADERVVKPLEAAGKTAVIPPKSHRRNPRKFKQIRAIATRYDKTARNFLAAFNLLAVLCWLN